MTTFFTSDTHFGHKNIIEYCNRPWDSVDEMNEGLIENWNKQVTPTDTVFVLGDVAMGKIDDSLALLPRLNGHKRLITGNHDRCWPGNGTKHLKWITRYTEVGFEPTTQRSFVNKDHLWLMDHFPYEGDHTEEERYSEFRPVDRGMWLLHGHVHDLWHILPQKRMINVGVDVWNYAPVALDTLTELRDHYDG